ncbi:DUF1707 SHOCT-like domain-containing protein [Planosporangium sp. 12N6]|uniref:DUF1707 SHOCT-like domain-containing protein n=1 Tax=Planosporangium spinosum TaxID=3402278 RepID=UPI003CF4867B
MAERREDLRAADVDRQFVADRLKAALGEGRLSLHEYDERLREAYTARTYGDLDRILADLPLTERSQLVPPHPAAPAPSAPSAAPESEPGRGFPRWIFAAWSGWLTVTLIVNAIWLASGTGDYWPKWVMLPWGAVLLAGTVTRLAAGNHHTDAGKEARRRARRARRQARRGY